MLDAWPILFRKAIGENKSRGLTLISWGAKMHLALYQCDHFAGNVAVLDLKEHQWVVIPPQK